MDLYQLRYFLEAARELSFTRAAENLHVSPSAVSRSMSLLELSVKKELFVRGKRRVTLSAAGDALKARAERIFDEIELAAAELAGEAQAPAALRLGSREMITNYLLPGPLAAFKTRWPDTRFAIVERDPGAMTAALKKDQLDLVFYYADVPDPALESVLLGKLRSHVYASKKYLKSAPRPRTLGELLRHPFIAPPPFGAAPGFARPDGFPDQRYKRKILYEANSLEAHRRFVLSGLCVGVLPDVVMEDERRRGDVVALDGPAIHRDIYCFRRRNRVLPKAVDVFLAEVRAAIRRRTGSQK
jgi:DNA-binding transcriptional LysR family regulator